MLLTSNQLAFLALIRAGLWENLPVHDEGLMVLGSEQVDWGKMYQLAEEQSVNGIVLAGMEHSNNKPPQVLLLQWIGEVQMIEQRNREMNDFIASIVEEMRKADIYGLLVKGSGLAQCYERPLWRSCGDIDFFFSKDGYKDAVEFFLKQENVTQVQNAQYTRSFDVVMNSWVIELHGTLRNGLSTRMDREIDEVQQDLFYSGNVRSWQNGETQVFLPGYDNDLFLVFVHFVRHFYQNEFVLRQTCDWCRFLWTYKEKIDVELLEKRLKRAGLVAEWKAFAAFVVEYLGMPVEAMPLYDSAKKWRKKADKIMNFVWRDRKPNKVKDIMAVAKIFPFNTLMFLPALLFNVNWLKIKERLFLK